MARMFGTDGVRGIANEELTPLLAMQLGQAGAYVLTKENEHKPTIMVGCDTRISGDMLANALMAGACSVGANCIYVGVIPTPAVAYLTKKYKVDAGVVISASHNPVEFNGIKFFDGNGYKLPDAMEDEIEALIRNNMPGIKFPIGPGVGKIKYRTDAREEYINHAMRAVNVDLTGLKIVVDCAEGASFYTSVECLKELGGSVVAIHNNPDGTNINANCLIAVPTLELMAVPVLLGEHPEEEDALIVPMLDARRMEVYAEVLDRALKVVRPIQADIVDADTYKEYLDQHHVYFFGNGAAKCMETINHPNAHLVEGIEPLAKNMAPLAEKRFVEGKFEDVAYFVPFYLKDFVAKMPKKLL